MGVLDMSQEARPCFVMVSSELFRKTADFQENFAPWILT